MDFDKEMMNALEADGEKLRALTGEDHGPYFLPDDGDAEIDMLRTALRRLLDAVVADVVDPSDINLACAALDFGANSSSPTED